MVYEGLRGQSAIEYLMTYGWMLLVVAIAGGAVFSLVGDQSIDSVQGFDSNHLDIQDFGITQENGLMFSMSDPIGETEVKQIKISNPDSANITYVLNQRVSDENTVNLPGINPSQDGNNELEAEIIYNTDSLENLSTTGTINGNIEVDESFNNRKMIMNGLTGYWPLTEKYSDRDTTFDLTPHNNHGAKQNNPDYGDGIIGETAIEFDGETNYIDVYFDDELKTGEVSVSVWANIGSIDSEEHYGILQNSYNYGDSVGYYAAVRNGDLRFRTMQGEDERPRASQQLSEEDLDKWTHITFTFDKNEGELMIWQDGENIASNTNIEEPINYNSDTNYLNLGARTGESTAFDGKMNDIQIYNRVLSKDEIESIYEYGS